jgi:hypothetical protein
VLRHLRPGKHWVLPGLLALTGLLLGACAAPSAASGPLNVVVAPVATATGLATVTPTPVALLSPTASATLAVPTRTATAARLRTKTPEPTSTPTNTAPTATRTRAPVIPPTRTATATPGGARAGIGPAPDTSRHGVSATFNLEARSRTYRPDQKIWFRMQITNLTDAELKYGFIGVAVSDGRFHTSWSGAALAANSTLNWRDWVSVPETGDYTITLTMCLSAKEECPTTGTWVNLSAPVPVTIRN